MGTSLSWKIPQQTNLVDSSFIGMTCIFRVVTISCAVTTQAKMVCCSSLPLCRRMIFRTGPLGTEELEAVCLCVCVCVRKDLTFDFELRS